MRAKLSIITVCFNNKQGLIDTIESVKKQLFSDYEFIIVDGGSTDGSLDVIKSNKDLFDYWVSEKDNGIYHAMNKGILKSTGEYCLFLNSGDYLLDENILNHVFLLSRQDDILYGNIIKIRGRKKRLVTYSESLTFLDFYKKEPGIHHQAAFIKRSLFDKFGLYREDTYMIADWIFFFQSVVLENVTTKYINHVISVCDATGVSNQQALDSNPKAIKDKELKKQILMAALPSLVLKDYASFYKKTSMCERLKIKIKWKLSAFVPFSMFVRYVK